MKKSLFLKKLNFTSSGLQVRRHREDCSQAAHRGQRLRREEGVEACGQNVNTFCHFNRLLC